MSIKKRLSIADCREAAARLALSITSSLPHITNDDRAIRVYGVPRGGIPAAALLCAEINRLAMMKPYYAILTDDPEKAHILFDDLIDSGATMRRYRANGHTQPFYALFDKEKQGIKDWLIFPWEEREDGKDTSAEDIVVRLLQRIGEDPSREGLLETPRRVIKAWEEWAIGYKMDPKSVLKTFEDGAEGTNELVIVHNIPVVSKCEHHLADISGIAHVGYIPSGKIVGLSKLPRLVEVFSRRLQVQERLTQQIADALVEHLNPVGVGVIIRASHACMSTRGVKIHGSVTTTSAMRGALLNQQGARAEFLSLCDAAERRDRT